MSSNETGPWSFQRSAQSLEERLSAWPMWKKTVILVPVAVFLSAILVTIIVGAGYAIPILIRNLSGH